MIRLGANKEGYERMILAIDFDGTIVDEDYPNIGKLKPNVVNIINKLYDLGDYIIIWTNRKDADLKSALEFLDKVGIKYHIANDNIKDVKLNFIPYPKIYADIFIDDRGILGIPNDWNTIYNIIQSKRRKIK